MVMFALGTLRLLDAIRTCCVEQSGERDRQYARMRAVRTPDWKDHFAVVDSLLLPGALGQAA